MKVLPAIKWSKILKVSTKRRKEFFATFFCFNLWFFTQTICNILTYYLIFHAGIYWRIFILIYIVHILFIDKSGEYGTNGQGNKWFRSLSLWKHFADYFPMKIVKTVDLPANKNYIFAYHPHGLMAFSFFTHFGTNGTGFHEAYPGIRANLATLPINYWHPFYREVVKAWGIVYTKYETLKHLLSQRPDQIVQGKDDNFTSSSVALAIGGAHESMYTQKGRFKIHVRRRKGFVRIAIETGASIVPVFSFGETDYYDVPSNEPGTLWRRFQEFHKKIIGFVPVLFNGRGLLQYSYGLMPRRVPIHTVFGSPIDVAKKESPTAEDIDAVHGRYMAEVEKLFEKYKWEFVDDPENVRLEMV